MFSGLFATTEVLQTILDDLYAKASRPANDCVLMVFEGSFLARTGLVGPGNTTPQNTWRNNLNLQKGVGCYAPPNDLASQTFLDESRIKCKYLISAKPNELSGGKCSLNTTGAAYRNEDHRKWLRIDPAGAGYAVGDLMNVANYSPYVVPAGKRLPLLPLISALYHDGNPGLKIGNRPNVGLKEFCSDFNLSTHELNSYFDASSVNPYNAALLTKFPAISLVSPGVPTATVVATSSAPKYAKKKAATIPSPVLSGTPVTPPSVNSGWEAERYVAKALEQQGWAVYDVSRQRLGYDLVAKKGVTTRFVDVKSSVGFCSPSLTLREWQQASAHSAAYVLAILENFNPLSTNSIFWVPDPVGSCNFVVSNTVEYSISRTSWRTANVLISAI